MEPSKEGFVFQRRGASINQGDSSDQSVSFKAPGTSRRAAEKQTVPQAFVATHSKEFESSACLRSRGNHAPVSVCQGWTIYEHEVVTSTNLVAANLPVWSAVRADSQTAGRGRFQRTWVSDHGGLWLSAVVPSGTGPEWRALPLVVGLAVCDTLEEHGVTALRMRWPNDVLVGTRKLAGLLLDQFVPGAVVAGIGINVRNNPAATDPNLVGRVVSLADLLPQTPTLCELTRGLLLSLRGTVEQVQTGGLHPLLSRINALWGSARDVELELDGPVPVRRGRFTGVDEQGRLLLATSTNQEAFSPHQVRHLTEI